VAIVNSADAPILALVGHPSVGKDTVAEYLVSTRGYAHVSTSDIIRQYVAENNLGEPTRELLQKTGKFLRDEHGGDFLVRSGIERAAGTPTIFSGLRTLAELEAVKTAGGICLAITADAKIRFNRCMDRGRLVEGMTFETFMKEEERERANPDPNAQNVVAVVEASDIVVSNDGTIEELYANVNRSLDAVVLARKAAWEL
jgi:dephospho-CoA kinase